MKVIKTNCLSIFLCFVLAGFFVSCVNTSYIEKDYSKNLKKLKACEPYTNEAVRFEFKDFVCKFFGVVSINYNRARRHEHCRHLRDCKNLVFLFRTTKIRP